MNFNNSVSLFANARDAYRTSHTMILVNEHGGIYAKARADTTPQRVAQCDNRADAEKLLTDAGFTQVPGGNIFNP